MAILSSNQISQADKEGMTPLMYAAAAGEAGTVRLLLSCGCNVKSKNRQGATALMLAAKSACIGSAMLLIQAGEDPEAMDAEGRTPVFYAVQSGSEAMVELILDCGVRTELVDKLGKTLLTHAAEVSSYSVTRLLLQVSNLIKAPAAAVSEGSHQALSSSKQISAPKSQSAEPLSFAQRVASASKTHLFDVEESSPASSASLMPPTQNVFIPPVQLSKQFVSEPTPIPAYVFRTAEEDSNSSAESSPRDGQLKMPMHTTSYEVANQQRGVQGRTSTPEGDPARGGSAQDASAAMLSNGSKVSFSIRDNPLATPSAGNTASDDDSDSDSISVGNGLPSGSSHKSSGKRKSLGASVPSDEDNIMASIMASPMLKGEVMRLIGNSPAFQPAQHAMPQQTAFSSSFDFSGQTPATSRSPEPLSTPAPVPFSPGAQLWQQMLAASPGNGGLSTEDELRLLEALNAKWSTPGMQVSSQPSSVLTEVNTNGKPGLVSDRADVLALVHKMMKPHQVLSTDLSKAQFQWISNEVTNKVLKSKSIQASPNGLTPRKDEKRVAALVDKYVDKARRGELHITYH